jgi:ferredoxin--NADP+ reductase/benzoate/toluate 1,2-dioxygenase reductase subunit
MDIHTVKKSKVNVFRVISLRNLTPSTYVLRFERNGTPFHAGQHILLGLKEDIQAREYSIYSGEQDDFFEVLIKEVREGKVSKQLRTVKEGDILNFEKPVGYFTLKEDDIKNKKFLFIASGTGIAPFHSFVSSYPGLNYRLIHGVRNAKEAYESAEYDPKRLVVCTSRDKKGDFYGRVTDWLKNNPVEDKDTLCYLCGNCEMIHEAYDILSSQGIPSENLYAEVYF